MGGNDILTYGKNTDGCDPDSSWNVYIADNTFSTGDDCIAIKACRDWTGRLDNISTENVLVEQNDFLVGHGVSIGSETSGWIRNVTIRDSRVHGTNLAVRIKSMRGRGGGVEDVTYENITGSVISAIQLTLEYKNGALPTNNTATPELKDITIRNVQLKAEDSYLDCVGLNDSKIHGIVFENVVVIGSSKQKCSECSFASAKGSHPEPCKDGSGRGREEAEKEAEGGGGGDHVMELVI